MPAYQRVLFLLAAYLAVSLQSPDFSYYHKTEEINSELVRLSDKHSDILTLTAILQEPLVYAVDIADKTTSESNKQKNFILFGEHAREMISPETGLHMLKQLCGEENNDQVDIKQLLKHNEFRLILNANPSSRKVVEDGSYCLRTNENGVDLNRNWDAHWKADVDQTETNPGPSAFSEIETRAVKDSLMDYNPTTFTAVHSGVMGMYTPYAYSMDEPAFNEQNMLDVLDHINPKYCDCPMGAAGKDVGYLCPGTCLDYAYEHSVPYTFALEIYASGHPAPGYAAKHASLLQKSQKTKKLRGSAEALVPEHSHNNSKAGSCFIQTATSTAYAMTDNDCFKYFNPISKDEYDFTVNNWSSAILELVHLIHEKDQSR